MAGQSAAPRNGRPGVLLLGPVELVDAHGAVALAGKERRLLAYLALHLRQRVSEDRLIEALWGDHPPKTARRTLHANVSRLRRALTTSSGLRVHTAEGGYLLTGPPRCTDVEQAESLSSAATAAIAAGDLTRAMELLMTAEALWRGNSLGRLAEEPSFRGGANPLDVLRVAIVEDRVEAALADGRHQELAAELADLTAQHPLHERLWEARMVALYRSGQQAGALRVYQELRRVLGDGLGIEPSPQVRDLESAILRQDPSLRWSPADAGTRLRVPLPQLMGKRSGIPCVGRTGEMAQLVEAWQDSVEGRPTVVLVAGAPGVGKTRLAVELARVAHGSGGVVLFGTCSEGVMAPYQPFVEGLAHLVSCVEPAALAGLLGRGARELSHLVPDLAVSTPDLPEPTVSEPETERFRLFQAVTEWVATTARTTPLIFVLDDLHWAGPATLLLLNHLVSHLGDAPVCIVATYRDTELSLNPQLAAFLAALRQREEVVRLSIDGLDAAGCQELVRAVTGGRLGEPEQMLVDSVYRHTEGNPFFVQEVLRHLVDTGIAVTATDGHWLEATPLAPELLSEGVREVVRRRLSLLPQATREALAVASVIGQDFRFDLLAAAIGSGDVTEALEVATVARLLEESSDAQALRFRFTHALVQATIYHDLSGPRRTAHHARVAGALISTSSPEAHLHELAHHFVRAAPAGYVDEALDACQRAAEQALVGLAFEAAALHCRAGLELIDPADGPSRPRALLLISLAEALFRSGDPDFRSNLEAAWRLAEESGQPDLALRAALACSRGYWGNFVALDEGRVAALELALRLCSADDDRARSRLQADLAAELIWEPSQSRSAGMADDALSIARRAGDPSLLATVLGRRLTTFWELARSHERQAHATEGLALASDLGDPVLQAQFATYGIFCAVESAADADHLDTLKDLAEELMPTIGQPMWEYSIHYAMMNYHTVRSGPAELQAWLDKALDIGTRLGLPEAPFLAMCELADLHWWKDTYEEIVDAVEAIAGEYENLTTMQTWMAAILARTGRREPAQQILDRFSATGFDVGRDHSQGIALAECALAAADLGDVKAAGVLVSLLTRYRGLVLRNPINAAGPTEWFLGRLFATLGDDAAADAAFEQALAVSERMKARMWLAHIRCDWAEVLERRPVPSRPAEVRRLASLALAGATELELTGIARRAHRLMDAVPERRSP